MLVAAFASAIMQFLQKRLYISSDITAYETFYWSSMLTIIIYAIWMKSLGVVPFYDVSKDLRTTLVLRGIFGFTTNTLQITSIMLISLTQSSVLYWTIPIFTAIFANVFLDERITVFDWIATVLAFIGILII